MDGKIERKKLARLLRVVTRRIGQQKSMGTRPFGESLRHLWEICLIRNVGTVKRREFVMTMQSTITVQSWQKKTMTTTVTGG